MPQVKRFKKVSILSPTAIIVFSFALVILTGALLLTLPISSQAHITTPFIDCLFTATSATCVTGLVVRDTYTYWTMFGQTVIMMLIQVGGLGLVTFTMFFGSFAKRKFGLKDLALMQESVNYGDIPEVKTILRMVVTFSFTVEIIGAILLSTYFIPAYGVDGIFTSIFISVSAYCNAGFDIIRGTPFSSLTGFADNPFILLVVASLIIIGGLGVIVWYDAFGTWRKKHKLSLHSYVVFAITGLILVVGTVLVYLFEHNNMTMSELPVGLQWVNSFFQAVTARTAGFNSISTGGLLPNSKILVMIIMFIGAAPGSTAGGIKVTTFWVLVMTIIGVMRGRTDTVIRGKKVNYSVVYKALAIMIAALALVVASFIVIIYAEPEGLNHLDAAFESVSAFSTTGLSAGITPYLTSASKMALIINMFLGRVGLVSFAYSISILRAKVDKNEILPEGKILVG